MVQRNQWFTSLEQLAFTFFSYWINELRRFVSSAISRWPPIKVRGFLTSSLDQLLFTTPAKGAIVVKPDVSPHPLRRKRGVCQCAELLCFGWEGARLHPLLVAGGEFGTVCALREGVSLGQCAELVLCPWEGGWGNQCAELACAPRRSWIFFFWLTKARLMFFE